MEWHGLLIPNPARIDKLNGVRGGKGASNNHHHHHHRRRHDHHHERVEEDPAEMLDSRVNIEINYVLQSKSILTRCELRVRVGALVPMPRR